ncbi:NAD(P)H-dependent oxidoreductase [Actinoplanes sp. Pm04-4]|uniref:NAD(P)H-dependent oxidoreductase n=1 Tax=Paractinoplanes pyxinae TaxID=2997416 RepID=A0ABT4AZ59_9ACTN|nr:NAD(P)H-dependent oxidoreductase [Actinoplanes pyxinae]MCY1139519.1 NAD(P)H-dependent oxidoreductase [Actinoplanes pyxinae]
MPDVVVISGHPTPASRTLQLATALGQRIARSRGNETFVTVDVAELGPGLLTPDDGATGAALMEVQDAALLIVATPTYRGTFSGALKVLLDQLPANALAGVLAVPVVTAEVQSQAETAEAFLARLLRELGADVVDFGLTATGPELADPATVADQYTAALIA